MINSNNPYLLPKRVPLASGDDTFEPKHFRQLIEQLPVGNIGQVSQNVHHLLQKMNLSVIPVSSRLSNLEAILKPLMVALDALTQGFAREPLPLKKRAAVMSGMYESLCILAIQGYKVVLDQYHHETFTGQFLHRSNRVTALHRVLYFLGRSLLHAYRLYRPAPRHIWLEIHGIHRYAFDQKLADRPVENEDQSRYRQSSVNDLYKQILLLSLAGPYRLMQGEVVRVYQALLRFAPKTRLLNLGSASGDAGPFMVDIGIDEAPRFMGAERDRQVLRGWVLDTSGMALLLADELEATAVQHGAMRPQDTPDKLAPDLLARLMLSWGIGSRRVAERDDAQGEVFLLCGLQAIYADLGGADMPDAGTRQVAFNTARPGDRRQKPEPVTGIPRALLEADEYVVQEDPQLQSIRRWIADNNAPAMQKAAPVSQPTTGDEPAVACPPVAHLCPVYNESSNGYHLGWSANGDASISVGELVAVTHQDAEGRETVRLGVIRWMRIERPDVIDFGVELIAGDAQPVIFFRQWGRNRQEGYGPGLLLQRPNEQLTIITAPFYSEQGERTWLISRGDKKPILLIREIEATASFIQFYFDDPSRSTEEQRDETTMDETDFEQLWTSL